MPDVLGCGIDWVTESSYTDNCSLKGPIVECSPESREVVVLGYLNQCRVDVLRAGDTGQEMDLRADVEGTSLVTVVAASGQADTQTNSQSNRDCDCDDDRDPDYLAHGCETS